MSRPWLAQRWPLQLDEAVGARQQMVLAHGAGAGMDSGFMGHLARELAHNAVRVIRFEFEYMAARRLGDNRRPPPPMVKLVTQWHDFIEAFQASEFYRDLPIVAAGKSMGGRVASHAVIERPDLYTHLACFGFPFHANGKPAKTRIEHLPQVSLPGLVVQGTRDSFGNRDEVAAYPLGGICIHWLAAADHDFVPLRRSGMSQEQTIAEAAKVAADFSSP